jgi:diguanylate cyclase (GGDEF)-like protein
MPSRDPATIARSYIYLYGIGATLVLATLAFPGDADRWEPGILGVVVAAYCVTALLIVRFDRLPNWFYELLPLFGTILISVIIASAGAGGVVVYATIYFWAVVSACSLFSARAAVLNMALMAACYAVVLAITPNVSQPALDWLMVTATIAVLALLLIALRRRGERLLDLVRRRSLKQQRVAELGRLALGTEEVPRLCSRAAETVVEALVVQRSAVWGVTGEQDALLLKAAAGSNEARELPELLASDPLVQRALKARTPVLVGRSAGAAIWGPDGAIGLITAHAAGERHYDSSEADFLQAVAHVIGEATERVRVAREREHQALHDHMTGRPNRTLFTDRLTEALTRCEQDDAMLAIYFLDLDDFKLVNDSFGHGAGDDLLKAIGPRLRDALVMTDTVARFGGDEFAILCEGVEGEAHAIEIAGRLRAALVDPFEIEGSDHRISASIGIALSRGEVDAEELVAHADAAMYRAKERTRGGFEFFDASLRDRVRKRLKFESALRSAPDDGQLELAIQPIVALPEGEPVGSEALLRWEHPELGKVSPAEFIPIAEETGAILPLGDWVLREAFGLVARWRSDSRRRLLPLHVNLSARQLAQPDLVSTVREEFERSGARRRDVAFEITEHALISEKPGVVEALERLQAMGSMVILDDFGTGYSSLSHLKQFPIDVVKIDRSFISNLTHGRRDAAIVAAVLGMADAFALDVVAEGIEELDQVQALVELGCRFGQGYLYAKPAPADQFDPQGRWIGDLLAVAQPDSSAVSAASIES